MELHIMIIIMIRALHSFEVESSKKNLSMNKHFLNPTDCYLSDRNEGNY